MSEQKHGVGIYADPKQLEPALQQLQAAGFPMQQVSVIVKNANPDADASGAQVTDRVGDKEVGAATGVVMDAIQGSIWGTILVGLTSLAIPGVGPIVAAGSLGAALVASVAGTGLSAASAGQLAQALTDLGIPADPARVYTDRLLQGNYLVVVNGTEDEVHRAEAALNAYDLRDWGVY